MRFSAAFCTVHIGISRQCWKRSFRLGFFAAEVETNLRHTLGRKTWLDHHFRETTASCCFYTWGIAAGKQASGGCDQSSNLAQFCTEMHVFNRGFSYATHFWYNAASFKTAAKKELNIFAVIELIDRVLDILWQNRSNCENVFHKIFDQAKNECEKYDAPLLIPKRCKSQIFRDNYLSDDPEHFFREAIFVSYLDHLIVEMENRFFDQKQKCRNLWGWIPTYCAASPNTAQDLESFLEIYQEGLSPKAAVVPEVQRWVYKWKKEDVSTVPSSAIEALCACHADIYPNIYILLTILGTLSVSTATSERSFSTMGRLRTYLRSSIGNEWMTGLALLSIHKDRQIDREKVMN